MTKTTIAAAPAAGSTLTSTAGMSRMWAVLDRRGSVVVLFGGGEAEAEARSWQARGYRISQLAD